MSRTSTNTTPNKTILIKYGGNAMTDQSVRSALLDEISGLKNSGFLPVIVHGGGPVIKQTLEAAGIESEFVAGHRKTDAVSMKYVEMALRGAVNGELVSILNRQHAGAVGISGKDGNLVIAEKRYHTETIDGKTQKLDLGQVGNVKSVDPRVINTLLNNDFLPVISPVSLGEDGLDYNINADMFAGHIAGALQVHTYFVLTDVDGLMEDINHPESLIKKVSIEDLKTRYSDIIQGGMIPKIESCEIALDDGAQRAVIINGTRQGPLTEALTQQEFKGTQIIS